jgi:hypothetical protein
MYVFSRSGRLSGTSQRQAMAWAVGIAEKVTQITGHPVSLHSRIFSSEVGTLTWATTAPDLATLEAAVDKLMADDGYHEMAETGLKYMASTTLDDRLSQIIHPAEMDPTRSHEYVSVVRTTIRQGQMARGGAAGVEIAQRVEQITGVPVIFMSETTGNYGEVSWVVRYADVAEMERFDHTLYGDPTFIGLVDSLDGVFAEGDGSTQAIYRRVM